MPGFHSKDKDVIVRKGPAKQVKDNERYDRRAAANANQVWVHIIHVVLKFSNQKNFPWTYTHMKKLVLHQFHTYQGLKNTLLNDSIEKVIFKLCIAEVVTG